MLHLLPFLSFCCFLRVHLCFNLLCLCLTAFVFQKVIEALQEQSGPGELHENSLLIVMGDHGQTLNGDHGGGSAEEV